MIIRLGIAVEQMGEMEGGDSIDGSDFFYRTQPFNGFGLLKGYAATSFILTLTQKKQIRHQIKGHHKAQQSCNSGLQ